MSVPRYNTDADNALNELYDSVGANNAERKINILEITLGGSHNFYAFGGENCDEAKLGCLENAYLSEKGLIDLTLV